MSKGKQTSNPLSFEEIENMIGNTEGQNYSIDPQSPSKTNQDQEQPSTISDLDNSSLKSAQSLSAEAENLENLLSRLKNIRSLSIIKNGEKDFDKWLEKNKNSSVMIQGFSRGLQNLLKDTKDYEYAFNNIEENQEKMRDLLINNSDLKSYLEKNITSIEEVMLKFEKSIESKTQSYTTTPISSSRIPSNSRTSSMTSAAEGEQGLEPQAFVDPKNVAQPGPGGTSFPKTVVKHENNPQQKLAEIDSKIKGLNDYIKKLKKVPKEFFSVQDSNPNQILYKNQLTEFSIQIDVPIDNIKEDKEKLMNSFIAQLKNNREKNQKEKLNLQKQDPKIFVKAYAHTKDSLGILENKIKAKVSEMSESAKATAQSALDQAKATVQPVLNDIKATASEISESAKATVQPVLNDIKAKVSEMSESAKATAQSALNQAKATASKIEKQTFKMSERAEAAVQSGLNTVKTALSKPVTYSATMTPSSRIPSKASSMTSAAESQQELEPQAFVDPKNVDGLRSDSPIVMTSAEILNKAEAQEVTDIKSQEPEIKRPTIPTPSESVNYNGKNNSSRPAPPPLNKQINQDAEKPATQNFDVTNTTQQEPISKALEIETKPLPPTPNQSKSNTAPSASNEKEEFVTEPKKPLESLFTFREHDLDLIKGFLESKNPDQQNKEQSVGVESMKNTQLENKQTSLLNELKGAYKGEKNKRIKALRGECIKEIKTLRKESKLTNDQDRINHFSKEETIKQNYDILIEKSQDIISSKGIFDKLKTGIKNLPNYFSPKDYGERTLSTREIAQDSAKTIGKAGLIAAGFVPGPIGITAGVINGLRVASNAADKMFGEKPKTLLKIAKYAMMAGTAIVFGAAGSVGAAGAFGLVAAGANAIVKSNEAVENKLIKEEKDRIFNGTELEQNDSKSNEKGKDKNTKSQDQSREKSNSEKTNNTAKTAGKIALGVLAVAGTAALGIVTGGIGLVAGAAIVGIGTLITKIVESRKDSKTEEITSTPTPSNNQGMSQQPVIQPVFPSYTPTPFVEDPAKGNPSKKGPSIF